MRAGTHLSLNLLFDGQDSQFKFRLNHYSPQPSDVIYGYPEVATSGAGTDRKLRK